MNVGKTPVCIVSQPCSWVAGRIRNRLVQAGLTVSQSFDLRDTRAVHEGCPCPHHGTEACTCQLIVLLVYAYAGEPVTLILDGRDNQTWVFLDHPSSQDAQHLSLTVRDNIRLFSPGL